MSTRRSGLAFLAAACAVALASPSPGAARPAASPLRDLSCRACLLVGPGERELFARKAGVALPMASATKMMTALVVRSEAELGETVRVSSRAAATPGGGLELLPGDRSDVEGFLAALLMESSNDAAVALAEHVAGSEEGFVELMNARARAWGLQDTGFSNAHGLDAPGHRSSARDLAELGRRVLADPVLAPIVAAARRAVTISGDRVILQNRNSLLETYPGANGVKTGYTLGAGEVLVASARRRGITLVAVVLGARDAAADARALLDFGFSRLTRSVLARPGRAVGVLVFDPGGAVPVLADGVLRGTGSPRLLIDPNDLSGGVEAGQRVGWLVALEGGQAMGRVPAVAGRTLRPSAPPWVAGALVALLAGAHEVASWLT